MGGPKPRLGTRRAWRPIEGQWSRRTGSATSCGGMPSQDPSGVLQSHLSRLRRSPSARSARSSLARPATFFRFPDEAIDAGRFELLRERANSSSNPKEAAELLERALACWRGSAFKSSPSTIGHVRGDASRRASHRSARGAGRGPKLALGAHAPLIGDLEALVTQHPLRERFWQQLIVALYRSGRSAEALRRAETLRVAAAGGARARPFARVARARSPCPQR